MTDALAASAPTLPAGRPRRADGRQLGVVLAASALPVLGAVLIAPVLPSLQEHFADRPGVGVLVPVVLTVPALVIALTAPLAGYLTDRSTRRRVLIAALAGYGVAGTAPLYLSSLTQILVSRVLVGFFEAAIMTAATTLIGDYWSGAERSRRLGYQTIVATLAATAFLGLGGLLGAQGWRTPFWLYGIALLLVPLAAAWIWEPERPVRPRAALPPVPWRLIVVPCLVTLAGGVVFYVLIVELSFVLTDAGVSDTRVIGLVSALMSIATAAGSALFARVAERSVRVLVPCEFALAGLGLIALRLVGDAVPLIAATAAVTGLATGLLLPTLLTWALGRLQVGERGRATGLFTGALFAGEFASPLVVIALQQSAGRLTTALAVLGVGAVVVGAVVAAALPSTGRGRS